MRIKKNYYFIKTSRSYCYKYNLTIHFCLWYKTILYQRISTVQDSLKCDSWSPGMWHTTGDEKRSHWVRLIADTSLSTYLQRDAGYVPQTQGRVIQKSFITPKHHEHVTTTIILQVIIWKLHFTIIMNKWNRIYYYLGVVY